MLLIETTTFKSFYFKQNNFTFELRNGLFGDYRIRVAKRNKIKCTCDFCMFAPRL